MANGNNLPSKVFAEAAKIRKEDNVSRDQSIAIAASKNRRGELDSPPQGVRAFDPTPDMVGRDPLPDRFSPTPDSKSIKKAPTPSVEQPSAAGGGPPSGADRNDPTQNFVQNQTKQSDVPAVSGGARDERPADVDRDFDVLP